MQSWYYRGFHNDSALRRVIQAAWIVLLKMNLTACP